MATAEIRMRVYVPRWSIVIGRVLYWFGARRLAHKLIVRAIQIELER